MTDLPCAACQDRLVDYRFAELDDADRRAVAAHLAACGDCAVAYCRLDADLAGVGAALAETPPPEVHAALRARVAATFRPPLHRRLAALLTQRVPLYQGALAAAATVAAVLLLTHGPAPSAIEPGREQALPAMSAAAPEGPPAAAGQIPPAPAGDAGAASLVDDYDASSIPTIDPYLL
ncbi:MAG: zf-HC2 domain-containing protein [Deltaproteobacteria bacterium]|nr:zf-HC2 domain-containing protein [Deltaproteobacteria bacterium]